jgi:hypothetical protein
MKSSFNMVAKRGVRTASTTRGGAALMAVVMMSAAALMYLGLTSQQQAQAQQISPIPPSTTGEGSEGLRNAADRIQSAGFPDIAANLRSTANGIGGGDDEVHCDALGCPGNPPGTGGETS